MFKFISDIFKRKKQREIEDTYFPPLDFDIGDIVFCKQKGFGKVIAFYDLVHPVFVKFKTGAIESYSITGQKYPWKKPQLKIIRKYFSENY